MLSFAAEFPVSHSRDVTDFLNAVRSWVLGSPHTGFQTEDLANIPKSGAWSTKNAHEEIHTLISSTADEFLAGAKWILVADRLEWETSVVFSRNQQDTWVGIKTSRESTHPAVRLPPAKKPIAVRTLIESLGGATDGELNVSPEPFNLTQNDIPLAARLISGRAGCRLPVVYVSCGFGGEYSADPNQLANDLAGMAHVVVEPNRPFSLRLRIEVESENVYGGTIGVYWPEGAGRRVFFLSEEFDTPLKLKWKIVDEVRIALMNRRPLVRCTWSAIEQAVSRDTIRALRASGSLEVEKYVESFDTELKAKDEQLKAAEAEIDRLTTEIRGLQTNVTGGVVLRAQRERDLYEGEMIDIVREALQDAASHVQPDSRREHVLKAILENIPSFGIAKRQRESLKDLLRDYRRMDKKVRRELENMGFSIEDDGKHYKIKFAGDDRYTFILSKSGSDRRGGLNAASDISKRLF